MNFVNVTFDAPVAVIKLNRGKVNALNSKVVREIRDTVTTLEKDTSVKSIILTGEGKFFSFGFDIPGFLDYSKEDFKKYLLSFTSLYTELYLYPKPIIAALNGHAVAGGFMLATSCDYRLMVEGKARISLNEVTFGSSVFAGSIEILKKCVGFRNAELIAGAGSMYSAAEAHNLGLVDTVTSTEDLLTEATRIAREYADRFSPAFTSIKRLLRQPVVDSYIDNETESIDNFLDIWYSPPTRANIEKIKIY